MTHIEEFGLEREVWLANRTDGISGYGTAEEPYDASSRDKFDLLMSGFPTGITIHLYPGTYETAGTSIEPKPARHDWFVKDGWKIIGAGTNTSTIKIVIQTGDWYKESGIHIYALGSAFNNCVNNILLKDFTIDCNFDNVPLDFSGCVGGWNLGGYDNGAWPNYALAQNHRYDTVIVTKYGSRTTPRELLVCCSHNVKNALWYRVRCDYPVSISEIAGASIMCPSWSGNKNEDVKVIECMVDNTYFPHGDFWKASGYYVRGDADYKAHTNAFGSFAQFSMTEKCFAKNVKVGAYHNKSDFKHCIIRDCHFTNLLTPIYFKWSSTENSGQYVLVENCVFDLLTGVASSGFFWENSANPYKSVWDATIRGNYFRETKEQTRDKWTVNPQTPLPTGLPVGVCRPISVGDNQRLAIHNNIFWFPTPVTALIQVKRVSGFNSTGNVFMYTGIRTGAFEVNSGIYYGEF